MMGFPRSTSFFAASTIPLARRWATATRSTLSGALLSRNSGRPYPIDRTSAGQSAFSIPRPFRTVKTDWWVEAERRESAPRIGSTQIWTSLPSLRVLWYTATRGRGRPAESVQNSGTGPISEDHAKLPITPPMRLRVAFTTSGPRPDPEFRADSADERSDASHARAQRTRTLCGSVQRAGFSFAHGYWESRVWVKPIICSSDTPGRRARCIRSAWNA